MNDGISHLTKPKISACQTNGYRVLPWLNAGAEHCFETLLHGQASSFGNYPIPQVKQYLGGGERI